MYCIHFSMKNVKNVFGLHFQIILCCDREVVCCFHLHIFNNNAVMGFTNAVHPQLVSTLCWSPYLCGNVEFVYSNRN